jgi:reactive intermediate/imine deaminase
MSRTIISTPLAPAAIGPYSQGVAAAAGSRLVFLSGQLGLDPATGNLVDGGIEAQARQAFTNLRAVAEAAGGSLGHVVKFTLFLTDLSQFATVNQVMAEFVPQPYPARSTIGVAALPKGGIFEVEAILAL